VVAPFKLVPVTTTTVPAVPEVGAKLDIAGLVGGGGLFDAALPQPAAMASVAKSRVSASNWAARRAAESANLLKTLVNVKWDERPCAAIRIRYCWQSYGEPTRVL